MSPRTIEVLLNAYSRLKVTDTWTESVPPEVLQVTLLKTKALLCDFRFYDTDISFYLIIANNVGILADILNSSGYHERS